MVSDNGMTLLTTTLNKKHYLNVNQEHLVRETCIMANANENLNNPDRGKVSSGLSIGSEMSHQDNQRGYPIRRKDNFSPSITEDISNDSVADVARGESIRIASVCSQVDSDGINETTRDICSSVTHNLDGRSPSTNPITSGKGNHDDEGICDSESSSNTASTRQALREYRYVGISRDTTGTDNVARSEDNRSDVNLSETLFNSYDGDHSQSDTNEIYFEELDVKPTIVDEDIGLTLHDEQAGGRSFLCKLCGRSFAVQVKDSFENSMELHAQLYHAGHYSCSLCDKTYRWRRSLDKHIIKLHPDASLLECETCGKKYRNNYSLYNHMRLHFVEESRSQGTCGTSVVENLQQGDTDSVSTDPQKRFCCQLCSKSYVNKGSLRKHMRLAHSEVSLCKCEICEKVFKNEYMLREHARKHNSCHICKICKRTFYNQKRLKEHIDTHNLGKPACNKCEKEFSSYDNLKRHMLLHSDEIRFLCDICGKTFVRLDRFNRHMSRHLDEKPFACPTCNKTFRDKFSLNLHIRKHTGEKPFLCNICGKSFGNKGTLRMHISGHTGDSKYKCNICNKTFAYRTYRTAHMRIHTSEKPYKCSICSKEFTQKSSLNFHMGSHSGEKKHKCSICAKAFLHLNYLNVHMRSHTGEKPYKCSSCQKGFSQRSSLNTHMRICM